MQMLMARCMGALCALMISGCTLVEQIGALSGDQDAAVPALSGLETHADWTSPEDQENTPAPSVRVPRTTGDDAVPRPKTKPEIVDPKALVLLSGPHRAEIPGARL